MSEYEDNVHENAADEAEAESHDEPTFKLAEVRSDGSGVVLMEDGRMFPAPIKEGVAVRKNAKIALDYDGEDKDGVPQNPTITGLAS